MDEFVSLRMRINKKNPVSTLYVFCTCVLSQLGYEFLGGKTA